MDVTKTYLEIATCYDRSHEPQIRDRFLLLAADAAHRGGQRAEAEKIRGRLLQANPHHLLKPFESIEDAYQSADVQSYIEGLKRTYPQEQAGALLKTLQNGQLNLPPIVEAAPSDAARLAPREMETPEPARDVEVGTTLAPAGYWFATALFYLMLVLGLALLAYTFAQPWLG